jgi:glyoxylase I family protein
MIGKGVHHVSYAVQDLDRSARFYEDVLGLPRVERPELGLPGIWYETGSSQIHLIQTPEGADVGSPPSQLSPLANHNAFAIDDYSGTLSHFKKHDVDVLETSPENGQMWVRDPDGNILEFITIR